MALADISRTNYPAHSAAASAAVNTDFNRAYDAVNSLNAVSNTNAAGVVGNTNSIANIYTDQLIQSYEVQRNTLTWVTVDRINFIASRLSLQSAVDTSVWISITNLLPADGYLSSDILTITESASTWYAVWVVCNDNAQSPKLVFHEAGDYATVIGDLNPNDKYLRRVGWVYNDAGKDVRKFYQETGESLVMWDDMDLDGLLAHTNTATASWVDVDASAWVPPTSTRLLMSAYLHVDWDSGGETIQVRVRPDGSTAATGMPVVRLHSIGAVTWYDADSNQVVVTTDDAQAFEYIKTITNSPVNTLLLEFGGAGYYDHI